MLRPHVEQRKATAALWKEGGIAAVAMTSEEEVILEREVIC